MAVLQILTGKYSGRKFQLTGELQSIGRHPDNDICINLKSFELKHAEIQKIRDSFAIRSLAKASKINVGEKQKSQIRLSNGKVFELGGISFKFLEQHESVESEALLFSVSFDPMSSEDPNQAPLGLSGFYAEDDNENPVPDDDPADSNSFAELPSQSAVMPLPTPPPAFTSAKLSQLDPDNQRDDEFLTEELHDVIAAVRNSDLEQIRQSNKGFQLPADLVETPEKADPFENSESLSEAAQNRHGIAAKPSHKKSAQKVR